MKKTSQFLLQPEKDPLPDPRNAIEVITPGSKFPERRRSLILDPPFDLGGETDVFRKPRVPPIRHSNSPPAEEGDEPDETQVLEEPQPGTSQQVDKPKPPKKTTLQKVPIR